MIYSTIAVLLLASHLLLDFLDDGPVTLLYPLIETGVGLESQTRVVFGDAVQDAAVHDPLPRVQIGSTNLSRKSYPLLNGYGILSILAFLSIYVGVEFSTQNGDDPD